MTEQEKKHIEQFRNTLSVGLNMAAAAELLIRTAMINLESAGLRFRGEAKRDMRNLKDAAHSVSYWYERLNEEVVGSDEDSMEIFDNILYNAGRLAMIGMHYYNIYNSENDTAKEDLEKMFRVIENLSLKSTSHCFTQEFINNYKPKV